MPTKEVLRTGTFTDASGKTVKITEKDINAIAANFNSDKSENSEGYRVPLFLGHPQNESTAPAHGWVKRVFAEGGRLLAEFDKLTEAADKAIKNFSFRDVSVSIFKNILQHIGLTNTPAVPGLADFQFENVHKEETQILTFVEPKPNKGDNNMSTDNEIKLAGEKKDLEVKLTALQGEKNKAEESVTNLTSELETVKAENVELSKAGEETANKLSALEKEISDKAIADELKADTEFAENLCKDGKLAPADKEETITTLTELSGTKGKDLLKTSLSKANIILEEEEQYNDGVKLSAGESELVRLTKERMKEKNIGYDVASSQILDENPKLNLVEA